MASRGRPSIYRDSKLLCVHSRSPTLRLQANSERRAIINRVIDNGGVMTIGQICESFGFDVSTNIKSLIRAGWLDFVEEATEKE